MIRAELGGNFQINGRSFHFFFMSPQTWKFPVAVKPVLSIDFECNERR